MWEMGLVEFLSWTFMVSLQGLADIKGVERMLFNGTRHFVVCVCVCMHTHMHVCACAYVHACVHACVYECVCACVCVKVLRIKKLKMLCGYIISLGLTVLISYQHSFFVCVFWGVGVGGGFQAYTVVMVSH